MKTRICMIYEEKNDINGAPQLAWPKVCEYQRVRNFLQPEASLAPLKDSQCRRKELTGNIILGSLLLFMPGIGNHFHFIYISKQRSIRACWLLSKTLNPAGKKFSGILF